MYAVGEVKTAPFTEAVASYETGVRARFSMPAELIISGSYVNGLSFCRNEVRVCAEPLPRYTFSYAVPAVLMKAWVYQTRAATSAMTLQKSQSSAELGAAPSDSGRADTKTLGASVMEGVANTG